MIVLIAAAWVLACAVALAAAYRAIFAAAYLVSSGTDAATDAGAEPPRFAVLIPAHDEELLIEAVIRTIRAADHPQDRIAIHVIADNCNDATAARVRAVGENAHERDERDNPGKGQAIDWMLARLDLSGVDAVALFDADNLVDAGFFRAMSRELAAGRRCLQGYYGIANPDDSVMTRLLSVTYVMKNLLLNAGKARLGLSVSLMGTGMVFRSEVLAHTGWQAMSIGEDLEQTFCLLENGERIHFVADAVTHAQESTTLGQGYTQRQRWATSRRDLAARARRTVLRGLRLRSLVEVDAGLDVLMPAYSKLLNWTAAATVAGLALAPWTLGPLAVAAGALLYQVAEVGVALRIMRAEPRFVASLAFAPVFLVWKAVIDALALAGFRRSAWTRTSRRPHGGAATAADDTSSPAAPRNARDE